MHALTCSWWVYTQTFLIQERTSTSKYFLTAKIANVKVAERSFAGSQQQFAWRRVFKLDKQTWRRKSNGTQKTISKNLLITIFIWQKFYFYRILNNENFKMEVEQRNFVAHLIITVQLYYWLSKNQSAKMWWNKFQMVMINYNKLCANL